VAPHLLITVDLGLGATPIEGQISTATQPTRAFHGWLELTSVIEQLCIASRPSTPHPALEIGRSDTGPRKERQ
jgi:hypothetical protein